MISLADKLVACGASFNARSMLALNASAGSTSSNELINSAFESSDGYFYLSGRMDKDAPYASNNGGLFAKINPSGEVIWKRKIEASTTTDLVLAGGAEHSTGSLIAAGTYGTSTNSVLVKYSSTGTLAWQKTITDSSFVHAPVIVGDAVYVSGTTAATKARLVKFDPNGSITWQRLISASGSTFNGKVAANASADVFVPVEDSSAGAGGLLKYNSSGVLQWQKKYTSSVGLTGVAVASDGSLFVGGKITVSAVNRPLIMKLDSTGSLQWAKYIDVSVGETVQYLMLNADGNIVVGTQKNNVFVIAADGSTIILGRGWSPVSGTLSLFCKALTDSVMLFCGTSNAWATGNDGVFCTPDLSGAGLGTYDGLLTYSEVSGTLATASVTEATGTLTDAAGTATVSTGTFTESASTATFTLLEKTA